jgi:hypothetical protein
MALFPLGILSAAGVAGFSSDFELISTTVLGGTAASITFSSLGDFSSTYKHLQVRIVARTDNADTNDAIGMRFNADSGANYDFHQLVGNGTSVTSSASLNVTRSGYGVGAGATAGASIFGSSVIDILDVYAAKHKTIRTLGGLFVAADAARVIFLRSTAWRNTSSVTSLTFNPVTGTNFVAGTRISLYGIRG